VFFVELVTSAASPRYNKHFEENLSENGSELKYILYMIWRFCRNHFQDRL